MRSRTTDRAVLLTGASSGIGRAAARMFSERGDRVWAVSRSRERLEELAAECGGPSRVVPLSGDVADGREMEDLAGRILDELGVPDVIVANAGIGYDALFEHSRDDDLLRLFQVNVLGVVRTIRPFLAGMVERGTGRILMISSIVGKRGVPHYSAYCASKFCLHAMSEALRTELWRTGISVGVVCPASTTTEFHANKVHRGPKQKRYRIVQHSPESVARAIVKMAGSRRREMILGIEGKAMALVNAVAPWLVDRVVARMFPRKPR